MNAQSSERDEQLHTAMVRWGLAAMLACIGYLIALIFDYPLFSYFPMLGEWFWGVPANPAEELGPRIAFFGWQGTGVLLALSAWLIPAPWLRTMPAATGLIGVALLTAGMLAHEVRWFLI